jgi:hypothetical protein
LASGECEKDPELTNDAREGGGMLRSLPNPILRPAGSWVFAARAGLQVIGAGEVQEEWTGRGAACSELGQTTCSSEEATDFDERSFVMLGLDGLVHVAPGLRLGVGYGLVPYSAVDAENADETVHLGHEHVAGAIVEGLLPVSPSLALALRGNLGLRMLVLGGDLAEDGEAFLDSCRDSTTLRCEADEGPLFGSSFGVMLGFVGGASLRWRVDLAVDYVSLKLPTRKVELSASDGFSQDTSLTATRSWVLGGFEL